MLPILPMIGVGLATFFGFMLKHPILTKLLFFTIFQTAFLFSITNLKNFIMPYILDNSLFSLVAYFGILDGLTLYINIILIGFAMKQVLAFIRT